MPAPTTDSASPPPMFGEAFERDPGPALAWARRHQPIAKVPVTPEIHAWLFTRYEDVDAALRDAALSKRPSDGQPQWQAAQIGLPFDHDEKLASHMVNVNPPEHTRLRRVLGGTFSHRRMEQLRARIEGQVTDLLSQVDTPGEFDFVAALAYPLTIAVICDLLGIPEEYRGQVRDAGMVIDSSDSNSPELVAATRTFERLIDEVVALKRDTPGEDLISELIQVQRAGGISENELRSTVFLLVIGGHETTVSLVSTSILELADHPAIAAAARADAGLIPGIVKEAMRLHSPTQNATWRFTTEPRRFGDVEIQPGEPILLSLLSANRDPEVFTNPDVFDPTRNFQQEKHLAFGGGLHYCLGAALAQLEAEVAVTGTLTRFAEFELATPRESLDWWPSPIMRGLYSLPLHVPV